MFQDLKLIKLIQKKGDRTAANTLITLYYKEIYAYVFKQSNNIELSLDLTQEIFISMMKSINDFNSKKASFKTWLYKISSNKIIDYYRSKYYKQGINLGNIDDLEFKDNLNIEECFIINEDAREIMEIINKMEGSIQQIIRLKIFADMTFNEISKALEIKESTVKTRYYSAIRRINKILEEEVI
ncbi:RNA polymerase sigma factor [Clostridium weizhouense]|uniref:Sigma-70 family RNA polymerase sigma factor n=1 Tax=Clostridium weizhouense TaxID=2859781 RepID=A0ABS7AQ80_9CLOT|nr:sigma-70 family RNA polymerase sigma factor [Clostridium weizhouense]MBW6410789.1 sigma-70 family RNA polymerase sigma factor [Clostridium weizhouense]